MKAKTKARLTELGFKNYKEYVQSEEWRSFRDWAFKILGRKCWFCKNTNRIELHHTSYWSTTILSGDQHGAGRLRWFLPVCRSCHQNIHDIQKSANLSIYKATNEYRKRFKGVKMWMSKRKINLIRRKIGLL